MTPPTEKLIAGGKIDGPRIRRGTPTEEPGVAQDIAEAMVIVAAGRARLITPVTLPVDGGSGARGAPGGACPLED